VKRIHRTNNSAVRVELYRQIDEDLGALAASLQFSFRTLRSLLSDHAQLGAPAFEVFGICCNRRMV
jgi:hypothetical protein